ncbi:glycosyltransferase family 2 protein [Neisseria sp. Ec49-e6-T10]|uniref:glycosyltransferase family 2 protein n=1 Tax=Neisseria sp. Ec49-e6-T10 TaxID=3140744 RepID=UPI003EBBCE8B
MNNNTFNPCVIIPCYNHGHTMEAVLLSLQPFNLPCIIVDDASSEPTASMLKNLAQCYPWVTLIRHQTNQGKGGAVLTAFDVAFGQKYTHAIQIDADGQHQLTDIPKLIQKAKDNPTALISGAPIYDDSVPKSRLYGRYITHFWVWLETLSFSIKDSMCGFRVYPVTTMHTLAKKHRLGKRMDFDIEVMVRLYWQNTPIYFIPTKVIYPENGLSHFDALKDNVRISWMHTRLFFSMLPKMPYLLLHKQKPEANKHWSKTKERQGLWGMRFLLKSYCLFGSTVFKCLLYPVICYFWLTGSNQKKASEAYLAKIKHFAQTQGKTIPSDLSSFKHFMHFAGSILDKLSSWLGKMSHQDVVFPQKATYLAQKEKKEGTLILCSHLGNIEVCRALGEMGSKVKINALVFTQHAKGFNQVLKEINPQSSINLIEVTDIGPDTIILLQQKLEQGEWIAIVGDRTPVSQYHRQETERIIWSSFLGEKAPFPQGPFILAATLKCPVFLMFGLKPANQYIIYFEEFANPLTLPRQTRQASLQAAVDLYAKKLEEHCLISPLDWFNFYPFWQLNLPSKKDHE